MISVLSGGVGAARLLRALSGVVDPASLSAVVNVGDDLTMHGLSICPDLDTITYTLAGLNNDESGWGLAGETWRVMDELDAIGGDAWFRLGDRDLATHLYRTQRLAQGASKSDVTRELCERWGVRVTLVPVSDDPIETQFETEVGRLSFQEYFVRHRHGVAVSDVRFAGVEQAAPTTAALDAITRAERIVIAPSNPIISIAPILAVREIRALVEERRDDVVAVSPIIDGRAVKGPADRLLSELGHEVSCVGVADYYAGLVGTWVIDESDRRHEPAIASRGCDVLVTTTLMSDDERAHRLARAVLA